VKLAEQPKLQRNADDIEELSNAHTNKLTNEALIKLEAAKFKEHRKDRPAEVLQCFYIWEMVTTSCESRAFYISSIIHLFCCPYSLDYRC
jgi:hypothetical protein